MAAKVKTVAVIGSGIMGGGIAQVALQTGHRVILVDLNDQLLQKSMRGLKLGITRVAKKEHSKDPSAFEKEAFERLKLSTNALKAASGDEFGKPDLIIEAVVENLATKQKLFAQLDQTASESTLLASNTSSLSLTEIAKDIKRKDRFGGVHFFSPVPLMKLVEIVRTDTTSQETFSALMDFGKAVGKVPVACKDTPGFIVNRLLIPYLLEAMRLVERGDATPQDVDTAMVNGAGYPMGPFTLADAVGLDTCKFIVDGWHKKFPDNPLFKPSESLNKLVAEGKLGRKTGEGVYKYKK